MVVVRLVGKGKRKIVRDVSEEVHRVSEELNLPFGESPSRGHRRDTK